MKSHTLLKKNISPTAFLRRCAIVFLTICGASMITTTALAGKVQVSASLSPSTVGIGEYAVLKITVSGDNNALINLPDIDGLGFQSSGISRRMSIINGNVYASKTVQYIVYPEKQGTFSIEPITIESSEGKIVVKDKIQLKVNQASGKTMGSSKNKGLSTQPSPNKTPSKALKDVAFIDVVGLKKDAIVGEDIPVKIRTFFKYGTGGRLKALPALDNQSFTVKIDADNPQQERARYKGEIYDVVIYDATISPIKEGEFKLTFKEDTSIIIRKKSPRRRRNDPFSDPFFDSFFTSGYRKNLRLSTEPFTMKGTAPPADGQPSGFDGAIGKFQISATAPTNPIHAGDPLTLKIHVTGEGNFSRVKAPHMTDPKGWKTYPAKSHIVKNRAGDSIKIFEQTIIPRNTSVKNIPPLELVFYNPETKQYETTRTQAIPIEVLPGHDIKEESIASNDDQDNQNNKDKKSTDLSGKVPHTRLGWLRKERLDRANWLLTTTTGTSGILFAFALGVIWMRHHNTEERKEKARHDKAYQSLLQQLNEAEARGDAEKFFETARRFIQLNTSRERGIPAEAITAADLTNPDAKRIFEIADDITFSGTPPKETDLKTWKQKLLSSIQPQQ